MAAPPPRNVVVLPPVRHCRREDRRAQCQQRDTDHGKDSACAASAVSATTSHGAHFQKVGSILSAPDANGNPRAESLLGRVPQRHRHPGCRGVAVPLLRDSAASRVRGPRHVRVQHHGGFQRSVAPARGAGYRTEVMVWLHRGPRGRAAGCGSWMKTMSYPSSSSRALASDACW